MDNLKPEKNKDEEEEEENDEMGADKELSVADFVERGVKIDPKWTGFEALLAVVEVASQKYAEENQKKVSEHASRPVGVSKQEILTTEKALKKPMRQVVDSMEAIMEGKLMSSNCKKMNNKSSGSQKRSRSRQMGPQQIPDLPESFRILIESLKGKDVKLAIQKVLYESDLNRSSRMSIPEGQVREPFLHEKEMRLLEGQCRVPLKKFIGPSLEIFQGIELSRWELKKGNGTSSFQIVLINKWKDFRTKNGLQIGDEVQVWSFRINEDLCLALVRLTKPEKSIDDNSQHCRDK